MHACFPPCAFSEEYTFCQGPNKALVCGPARSPLSDLSNHNGPNPDFSSGPDKGIRQGANPDLLHGSLYIREDHKAVPVKRNQPSSLSEKLCSTSGSPRPTLLIASTMAALPTMKSPDQKPMAFTIDNKATPKNTKAGNKSSKANPKH